MRYLRKYKLFFEDGDGGGSAGSGDASCSVGGNAYVNATTAGMGDITNAVVGDLPGVSGASGSGDVTVVSKRVKRKKGNPTQVTDLRDLDDVKTNKIEESIIIGGDEIDEYDLNIIKDSMIELNDLGFKIIKIYKNGLTDTEKIFITLELNTTKMNRGIILHYFFNKDNVMDKSEKRLGKIGQKKVEYNPNEFERKVVNTIEYISHQLINMLDYYDAIIDIYHEKNSFNNFKIEIELFGESKKINPLKESYYSKQDYFQEIQSGLENYNIRPVALNNLLDMYENDILKNWEDGVTPNVFVCQIVKELELETGEFMNVNKSIGNPQTTIKYL